MNLGTQIGTYRREAGLTQDGLAQKLGVTNQAVSKWESSQCCPDVELLPQIADIFGVTLDELFGRAAPVVSEPNLPDDNILRVKLFRGNTLVEDQRVRGSVELHWHGPVLDLHCDCSVTCNEVGGSVYADGNVTCDDVHGEVRAGGSVTCDDVEGDVHAGGHVTCDDVEGDVTAGGNVTCDCVEGNVTER